MRWCFGLRRCRVGDTRPARGHAASLLRRERAAEHVAASPQRDRNRQGFLDRVEVNCGSVHARAGLSRGRVFHRVEERSHREHTQIRQPRSPAGLIARLRTVPSRSSWLPLQPSPQHDPPPQHLRRSPSTAAAQQRCGTRSTVVLRDATRPSILDRVSTTLTPFRGSANVERALIRLTHAAIRAIAHHQ